MAKSRTTSLTANNEDMEMMDRINYQQLKVKQSRNIPWANKVAIKALEKLLKCCDMSIFTRIKIMQTMILLFSHDFYVVLRNRKLNSEEGR